MEPIKFKSRVKETTNKTVTFEIQDFQQRWLKECAGLDLTVEVTEYKSKRSLNQNAKLWALIHEIDRAENGRTSKDGEMAIYCNLIRTANIKILQYEMTIAAYEETRDRGIFRHIEPLARDDYKDLITVNCYLGSSSFNTKQMADFIEAALDYAEWVGVDTADYEILREGADDERD